MGPSLRPAYKAGSWYAAGPEELRAEVDACLKRAEGLAPSDGIALPVTAAVVPHAGLFFSGGVAAGAYRAIRAGWERVETFVVFGVSHRVGVAEPAIWPDGAWDTPLGRVEVDADLAGDLLAGGIGRADRRPHADENSIEMQLPFIKRLFPEAGIVPVAMGDSGDAAAIGAAAAGICRGRKGGAVVALGSTDLTHYGEAFGVFPAGKGRDALDWIGKNDRAFLDLLVNMRLDEIVPLAGKSRCACGAGAAAAAAGWASRNGTERGTLLEYATSHDIMPRGGAEHVVGYGSVAFFLPRIKSVPQIPYSVLRNY